MRRRLLAALSAAAAVSLSSVALAASADASPAHAGWSHRNDPVCSIASPGSASCSAIRNDTVDSAGRPVNPNPGAKPNATPSGYGTTDIRAAYNLNGTSGGTVAIVDAYDDPSAEKDLGVYRSQYGLPDCTTANGCFKKVAQNGSTTKLPSRNGGWAQEISLDLDMVSATCPGCKILLVEASSASFANLAAAVNYAASVPGVVAISNSYGGSDSGAYSTSYQHAGIAVTASTGDSGYGVQSPASIDGVVAVGGTTLTRASSTTYSETAWSGAGSGCSTVNPTHYQLTSVTSCPKKANADVSAVADPSTGVAVYDSYAYQGYVGWMVFGGTSASSPIVASIFAMANPTGLGAGVQAEQVLWSHYQGTGLTDVVGGSNGTCTTQPTWCTAVSGWDGPTGLGSPSGLTAFSSASSSS